MVSNVVDYGVCVSIANGSEEFPRAPKGSPGVPPAEDGNLFEDLMGGRPLQEVEGLRNAHGCRQFGNHMNVVRHHTEFDDGDVMPLRDLAQRILANFFNAITPKHMVAVLRAPFQMVYILAYAMATTNKVYKITSWAGSQSARECGRAHPVHGNEFLKKNSAIHPPC